ncbi:HD domain-containing protein [Salipaludibacillus daqingensis]|uniref:HD domain-containing protein n=1 Tax=Salipaludibacillus daqingensis TaxID=3041001 RepID=UPI0024732401|nr:HD domain-containing protein [Salipaludibacillus daqingensis]
MSEVIINAEKWVKSLFASDTTGHDWYHTDRVRKNALTIARQENADLIICELAALLHDAGDDKFHNSEEAGRLFVMQWLEKQSITRDDKIKVMEAIDTVSFKGGFNRPPEHIEGKVVQDADRLDALGAIGVARCFMFAGNKGDAMHIPDKKPREEMTKEDYRNGESTAINHFYEKLLTLTSSMKTKTGYKMAEERHAFLKTFLDQFYEEWSGKK